MEIIFYHQPYTHADGEPMHNKHDFNSIAQPFFLLHECYKPLRTKFGFNWVYATLSNIVPQARVRC